MNQDAMQRGEWIILRRAGGVAALLAGLLFRRNLGAEVSLFTGFDAIPESAVDWFSLLQSRPLVGLSFLAAFDLVHYALLGLVFLALGAALWQHNKDLVLVAAASGLAGTSVSFSSNISLSMLYLSGQYATQVRETHGTALLTRAEALIALRDPLAVYPYAGWYMSLFLVALAGLLFSAVMLRNPVFGRGIAITGLLAAAADLTYCLTFALLPFLQMYLMALAGLLWMLWHLLIASRLLRWSGRRSITPVINHWVT